MPNLWLIGIDADNMRLLITRPACKTWSCPECASRNARKWIARIINGVNRLDGVWWMFTLTAHEKWRGREASVKNLRSGWKKLYNRARRTYEVSHYVRVYELHSDKMTFHLHGLVDENFGERWLKDNARECGLGYQVDIHTVDNAGQVAGYIAKYFLKSEATLGMNRNLWPKSLRRIEVSRGWPELPELEEFSVFVWERFTSDDSAYRYAFAKKETGYKIVDLTGANRNE
jgi:hypothetical protein